MLFMSILTWEPSKRNEIIKRRLEIGVPKEVKVIGEWTDISGGRSFTLTEEADPNAMMAGVLAYSDLIKFEMVPVMKAEDVMKLAKSKFK